MVLQDKMLLKWLSINKNTQFASFLQMESSTTFKLPLMKSFRDLCYHFQSLLLALVVLSLTKWSSLMLMRTHFGVKRSVNMLKEISCNLFHSENWRMIRTDLRRKYWLRSQDSLPHISSLVESSQILKKLSKEWAWTSTTWWKWKWPIWWKFQRTSLCQGKWWWLIIWHHKDLMEIKLWLSLTK